MRCARPQPIPAPPASGVGLPLDRVVALLELARAALLGSGMPALVRLSPCLDLHRGAEDMPTELRRLGENAMSAAVLARVVAPAVGLVCVDAAEACLDLAGACG